MGAAKKTQPADNPGATFAALLAGGYWPVAIHPRGATLAPDKVATGKEPVGGAWGKERRTLDWWKRTEARIPGLGVGVCLGPERGPGGAWLIDVEGDGDEAEASRATLFGGELVETMGWSSRRGSHQLLLADPDRLLAILPTLARFEVKGTPTPGVFKLPALPDLELRIGGRKSSGEVKQAQSVVPPTPGEDGIARTWDGPLVARPCPESFYAVLASMATPKPADAESARKAFAGIRATKWVASEDGSDERWAQAALDDELDQLAKAAAGGRNIKLNKVAFKLGRFVPRYLAREEAEESLREVAREIGLGSGETEATIRSGLEAGMADPKSRPPLGANHSGGAVGPRPGPGFAKEDESVGEPPNSPPDERPGIHIITDERKVNDAAVAAIRTDPAIFCRGGVLVGVRREKRKAKLVNRPLGSPWITALPKSTIRESMAHHARWTKTKRIPNTDKTEKVQTHPPDWSVTNVWERAEWDGIRHLEGVAEAPAFLADGSLLDVPGYDDASGLIYEPNHEFPPVPKTVNLEDARRAVAELSEVVADFPFAVIGDDGGATHRSAWLASLLTLMARHAIDGPCPLFFIDANTPGAGKSKLVDIVAILTTGRGAARTAFTDSDEEMRKQIVSIALEGDRLILIDNVATGSALGGASLDMVLTGTTVKGRVLGKSEMTRELPCYTVWYATGNNLGLRGDMLRRVIPLRLDSPWERPEERPAESFRIKGPLLKHVEANRGRLVVAALSILRGFFLAGRPQAPLIPMDYPEWCGVIRQAVYWASGFDPCATRRELIEEDPETNQLKAVVNGWAQLPKGTTGLTAAEALKHLHNPDNEGHFETLHNALMDWSRDGDLPGPKAIGVRLKQIKGRIIDGKAIQARTYKGTLSWYVSTPKGGGSGGSGGTSQSHADKITPASDGRGAKDNYPKTTFNTPIKPTTPTDFDETMHGDAFEGDLKRDPWNMTAS